MLGDSVPASGAMERELEFQRWCQINEDDAVKFASIFLVVLACLWRRGCRS
jgi:hypothetical protein